MYCALLLCIIRHRYRDACLKQKGHTMRRRFHSIAYKLISPLSAHVRFSTYNIDHGPHMHRHTLQSLMFVGKIKRIDQGIPCGGLTSRGISFATRAGTKPCM
jgi:hypothetical protein